MAAAGYSRVLISVRLSIGIHRKDTHISNQIKIKRAEHQNIRCFVWKSTLRVMHPLVTEQKETAELCALNLAVRDLKPTLQI